MPVVAAESGSTEDMLLDAARECILAVGWRRSTLTEIARRAGVSRMTVYRSWPDTQALLADLMTREWRRVDAEVAAAAGVPDPASRDYPRRVAALLVTTVRRLRRDRFLQRIIEVDPELLLPYLLERRGRSQQLTLDRLEAAIDAGVRAGTIRPVDPVHAARSLVLAAHGFVLSPQTMRDRTCSLAALEGELAELVRRYLER